MATFQEDNESMQAEFLLCFLHDLLDFTKSPQAEAFNFMFNNLDVYFMFGMHLPRFIANNSPCKTQAMKLLQQYIEMKPITEEDDITMFFSLDASVNNIDLSLEEAYDQFMRYHKRQINNQHFGIGTNNRASFSITSGQVKHDSAFKKKLRTSFMFTGNTLRKQSMS